MGCGVRLGVFCVELRCVVAVGCQVVLISVLVVLAVCRAMVGAIVFVYGCLIVLLLWFLLECFRVCLVIVYLISLCLVGMFCVGLICAWDVSRYLVFCFVSCFGVVLSASVWA